VDIAAPTSNTSDRTVRHAAFPGRSVEEDVEDGLDQRVPLFGR
jgi:hypothetical protein